MSIPLPDDKAGPDASHLVRYTHFKEILDCIEAIHALSMRRHEPFGVALQGPTGAGKSSILDAIAEKNPPRETPEGIELPFFRMETPHPVTIKGLVRDMLDLIGDPCADKGTVPQLTRRLINLIKACKIEYLAFDDFQHLYDQKAEEVLVEVSEWLKVLIKEAKICVIVTGVDDTVSEVLDSNDQLSRLFPKRPKLTPFAWSAKNKKTKQEFVNLVQGILLKEAVVLQPNDVEELYWRIHYATGGIVGFVALLIAFSKEHLSRQGSDLITPEVLDFAYGNAVCDALPKHLKGRPNPFTKPLTEPFVPPPDPAPKGKKGRRGGDQISFSAT